MMENEITCVCGKMKIWIENGQRTDNCPICGRAYIGRLRDNKIVAEEAHPKSWFPVEQMLNEGSNV
jgi:predicted RNA-binding Zn-ribbon protein involved in translation (DUF1610 family)